MAHNPVITARSAEDFSFTVDESAEDAHQVNAHVPPICGSPCPAAQLLPSIQLLVTAPSTATSGDINNLGRRETELALSASLMNIACTDGCYHDDIDCTASGSVVGDDILCDGVTDPLESNDSISLMEEIEVPCTAR